jgi:sensor histidine kinase YesM
MRFNNKLKYSFNIDEQTDFKSVIVPPLILQPFIENAIWNGLMPKTDGGMIHIHVTEKEGKIYCIVKMMESAAVFQCKINLKTQAPGTS